MNIKVGWLKLSGAVDYMWSGFKANPFSMTISSTVIGAAVGTLMSLGLAVNDSAGTRSFSDDTDRDVEMFEGGATLAFPDNCDLGSNHYLISKKKDGGLELSHGGYTYTRVLPIEAQEKITDDISACMDDMYDWVKEGRLNFAEDFRYQAGLKYSEAAIVFDRTDGEVLLYKDIIEGDAPANLHAVVKAQDSYIEDGDNANLYKTEFAKAQKTWRAYKSERNSRDPYFTRDEDLKNIDSYATYQYNSVDLKLWGSLTGSFALAGLLLISGAGVTWRGRAYDQRAENRQEKIKTINSLAKHKPLDF
jgi:hypothetical protein